MPETWVPRLPALGGPSHRAIRAIRGYVDSFLGKSFLPPPHGLRGHRKGGGQGDGAVPLHRTVPSGIAPIRL